MSPKILWRCSIEWQAISPRVIWSGRSRYWTALPSIFRQTWTMPPDTPKRGVTCLYDNSMKRPAIPRRYRSHRNDQRPILAVHLRNPRYLRVAVAVARHVVLSTAVRGQRDAGSQLRTLRQDVDLHRRLHAGRLAGRRGDDESFINRPEVGQNERRYPLR